MEPGIFGPPKREDVVEEWIPDHPLFAQELTPDMMNNPAMQAIKELKREQTPEELAESYKDAGNSYFKAGKNHYPDAITMYTNAIELKIKDVHSNAIFYSNRAMVHYEMENYGKSLDDAKEALKLDPKQIKAWYRAAKATFAVRKFDQCQTFCDGGLAVAPNNAPLKKLREEAQQCFQQQLEKEKKILQETKLKKDAAKAMKTALKNREITIGEKIFNSSALYPSNEVHWIEVDEGVMLGWPLLILYPESDQSDFIESFPETSTAQDLLVLVLSQKMPWDSAGKYTPSTTSIYFETNSTNYKKGVKNYGKQVFVEWPLKATLLQCLQTPSHIVPGFPVVYVFQRGSAFEKEFLTRTRNS